MEALSIEKKVTRMLQQTHEINMPQKMLGSRLMIVTECFLAFDIGFSGLISIHK
jgi:hypothetical protein